MKKILHILFVGGRIVGLVVITLLTLATAYIMFAPDSLPKPFYLVYTLPTPAPTPTKQVNDPNGTAVASANGANKPSATPAKPTPTPTVIDPGQGIMIDTGTKIVNLVDPTGRKYLRVGIVLEFDPKDPRYYTMSTEKQNDFKTTFQNEVNPKLPVINDVIITMLASQTFESVYTTQGKENLRKEMMTTINKQLPEYHVVSVYFTEFVVQ
jgi:flagellar basal body-associated protein FliL